MNLFVQPRGFVPVLLPALVLLSCIAGINTMAGTTGLELAPQSGARYQCGPTTLASVLAYHGGTAAEATIAEAIYSPTARGTLLIDLAWYAREAGFVTELRSGTWEDLQRAVEAGNPPIILLDVGRFGTHQPHFTALTACGPDDANYLSTNSKGKQISRKKLERQWRLAGCQYLLVSPSS